MKPVPADPRWPERYAKESARLAKALGARVERIEHLGAKPVIEVLVGVRDLDGPGLAEGFAKLGYRRHRRGETAGERHFRKRGRDAFDLSLVLHAGERWANALVLRAFQRSSPAAASSELFPAARAWARDPANGFQVRPALISDLEAITRVHIASWQTTYRGHLPDAFLDRLAFGQRRAQWMFAATQSDIGLAVATAAGQVVGFSCAGDNRDRAWPFEGELYALYLFESWQGAGVGRALFDQAMRWMANRGKRSALLWALAVNRKARAFYEARGGALLGEKPTEIDGASYPEVAYGWRSIR